MAQANLAQYHEALANRKITKREVARINNLSEAYVCRITPKLPPSQRKAQRLLASARKAHRTTQARLVVAQDITIEEAAIRCNCSIRTIYRYVAKELRLVRDE